ncbi:Reverse transcriptase domain-containing protein [Aphis craccivora]|uniref:Reverse transcriptase domain-containing protein n=1 Tax=Aphis craccivora TaxID=307492 RepID=A0A6G0XZN4_APHCR|nr:Reverse transcriptase domain-containing protein [Aphis craccivora]
MGTLQPNATRQNALVPTVDERVICPAEGEPTCAHCRSKHNAREKTCSSKTAHLGNIVRRTNYGKAQ